MTSDTAPISQQIAARYFGIWNTGDSSIAAEILSPGWVDHAHPEVTGPHDVQLAVERTRRLSRTCGPISGPSLATVTWWQSSAPPAADRVPALRPLA